MKKIISLHVIAKEWFDTVNGNSYFSARIQVNDETIYLPFQYGYERQYIQATNEALKNAGFEHAEHYNIEKYCYENSIDSSFVKHEKCLQRDVKTWGKQG